MFVHLQLAFEFKGLKVAAKHWQRIKALLESSTQEALTGICDLPYFLGYKMDFFPSKTIPKI